MRRLAALPIAVFMAASSLDAQSSPAIEGREEFSLSLGRFSGALACTGANRDFCPKRLSGEEIGLLYGYHPSATVALYTGAVRRLGAAGGVSYRETYIPFGLRILHSSGAFVDASVGYADDAAFRIENRPTASGSDFAGALSAGLARAVVVRQGAALVLTAAVGASANDKGQVLGVDDDFASARPSLDLGRIRFRPVTVTAGAALRF